MNSKEYSPIYFCQNMPIWKRKKDPILSKFFYRPISFLTASFCANNNIKPNTVSYVSTIVAVIACLLFVVPSNRICHIVGGILINVWLIMDCTDGNLARGYMRQPFGEFADGTSSYILVGLMCTAMGFSVFFDGGVFMSAGSPWIILTGALASSSDALMRLVYQKYKNVEHDMVDRGICDPEIDQHTDHSQIGSFRSRVENELGIGGILPLAILLATIFNALDIIVVYCFFYYCSSALAGSLIYFRKAIKKTAQYQERMPRA